MIFLHAFLTKHLDRENENITLNLFLSKKPLSSYLIDFLRKNEILEVS